MKKKYKVMVNVIVPEEVTPKQIESDIDAWLSDVYSGNCQSIVLETERIEEKEELELLDNDSIMEEVNEIMLDYWDDAVVEWAEKNGYDPEKVRRKLNNE